MGVLAVCQSRITKWRTNMSFTSAATAVIARLFQLVDAAGNKVAELGTTLLYGSQTPTFTFFHADTPTTSDSFLTWTNYGAVYPTKLTLQGPSVSNDRAGKLELTSTVPGGACTSNLGTSDLSANTSAGFATATLHGTAESTATMTAQSGAVSASVVLTGTTGKTDLNTTGVNLNTRPAYMEVYNFYAHASAAVNPLIVAGTDVPGCTTGAVNFVAGDIIDIDGVFDFTLIAAGAGTAVGQCLINGVAQAEQALFLPAVVGARLTIPQNWQYTVPATGAYTIKLNAKISAVGATYKTEATHTTLRVKAKATK